MAHGRSTVRFFGCRQGSLVDLDRNGETGRWNTNGSRCSVQHAHPPAGGRTRGGNGNRSQLPFLPSPKSGLARLGNACARHQPRGKAMGDRSPGTSSRVSLSTANDKAEGETLRSRAAFSSRVAAPWSGVHAGTAWVQMHFAAAAPTTSGTLLAFVCTTLLMYENLRLTWWRLCARENSRVSTALRLPKWSQNSKTACQTRRMMRYSIMPAPFFGGCLGAGIGCQ